MARKGLLENNKKRDRMACRDRKKRQILKESIRNKDLPLEERFANVLKLASLPRNGSHVRVRSRCFISGRPRGVYQDFSLSRIAFRDLALRGLLPGVRKSSW